MRETKLPTTELSFFDGMEKPVLVRDHMYYDPVSLSIDRLRVQATEVNHPVLIHHHRYNAKCDNGTKHEFYGNMP